MQTEVPHKPVVTEAHSDTTNSGNRKERLSTINAFLSDQHSQPQPTPPTTKAIPLMSIPTSARPIPPSLESPFHVSSRGQRSAPNTRQMTSTASAPLLSAYTTPNPPASSGFIKTPPHQMNPSQQLDMSVLAAQQYAFMRQYQQTLAACQMIPQSQVSQGINQQLPFQRNQQSVLQPSSTLHANTATPNTTQQPFQATTQAGYGFMPL